MRSAVALAALVLSAAGALAEGGAACAPLREACRAAGFVPAPAPEGAASVPNCVAALLANRDLEPRSLRPLPEVAVEAVRACRAAGTGERTAGRQTPDSATAPRRPPAAPAGWRGSNVILILADDLSWNLMPDAGPVQRSALPNLARMQAEGLTFDRFFVTQSLCCPSRASLLTGQLPHSTGVLTNGPPTGGYELFTARGHAGRTIAAVLHARGFRTAMLGKYLNGYRPPRHGPAPGWSDWMAGGNAYEQFDTLLNLDGRLVRQPGYLTDALAERAVALIGAAAPGPFFLYLAPYAPHAPFVPPDRYRRSFPDLAYPRTPAFGARPDAAAPRWLREVPALTDRDVRRFDALYRERLRSVKAIDDLLGAVRAALDRHGLAGRTYVIFTSDNGFHMGEYSLLTGKETPFDTDIRVPLVVVGPGVARGARTGAIAMNIDLAPTIAALAGAGALPEADGVSLVPLLGGQTPGAWRRLAVIEHRKHMPRGDDPDRRERAADAPDSYVALRFADALYVEYTETGERSFYDLARDPHALRNIFATLPPDRARALAAAARANATCAGAAACWRAQALDPLAGP